mmetsp:Transcript_94068/g.223887  ORF Transcript_94068/g.223887 Transcript_94068/m.223887 type:complete len:235 (-) Transcript_94068:2357-3061(-)
MKADVEVHRHVNDRERHEVAHGGEVEGEEVDRRQYHGTLGDVLRAPHADVSARDLVQESAGCIEGHLSPLLPLQEVEVVRLLAPVLDIEAQVDVFREVDVRGGFAHGAAVAGPVQIYKVRVAVVHSHTQPCLDTLDGGSEAPLRDSVDVSTNTMGHGEDVLSEADQPRRHAIPAVEPRLETLQDHGHLESFPNKGSHVGIHGLQREAFAEAECHQLIPSLSLGQVAFVLADHQG